MSEWRLTGNAWASGRRAGISQVLHRYLQQLRPPASGRRAGPRCPVIRIDFGFEIGLWFARNSMPIDYHYLKTMPPLVVHHEYSARDTILYALGVGAGIASHTDRSCLKFVVETALAPLSTMATVLGYPGFWAQDPRYGITWRKLLHRDQSVEIHSDLPVEGRVRAEMRIDEIYDRGAEKGALLCFSRKIYDAALNTHYATLRQVNVLRADGGFGGPPDTMPAPRKPPDRAPDQRVRLATGVDQALVYRLSGDRNPLHADPDAAKSAGFDRPILHGLSSFGVAGLAVTTALCAHDSRRLRRLDASFSSPVYPGECIEVSIWRGDDGSAQFEARVVERNVTVMKSGFARVGN
jgi:acyl dehydratase